MSTLSDLRQLAGDLEDMSVLSNTVNIMEVRVRLEPAIAALESEVERLRGLLAEALPELDEHDAEYKYVTKSGLKERMREACAQSGEDHCPRCGYTEEDKRIHGDHYLCAEDRAQQSVTRLCDRQSGDGGAA